MSQRFKNVPLDNFCDPSNRVKFRKVPVHKSKNTNIDSALYWKNYIKKFEFDFRKNIQGFRFVTRELSNVLPKRLYKRVAKIVPINKTDEEDDEAVAAGKTSKDLKKLSVIASAFDVSSDERHAKYDQNKDIEYICKSNIAEILTSKHPSVNIEPRIELERPKINTGTRQPNWFFQFLNKNRKERVKWQSKLYKLQKDLPEQSLYEQAEHLMNSSADDFCNWLNKLSENKETDISKDTIKELFSIDVSHAPLKSIQIDPKPINAVPDKVAKKWNKPEMSMELKLGKYLEERKRKDKRDSKIPKGKVAFGRTLPKYLQEWSPKEDTDVLRPVESIFPKQLLSGEGVFKGIGHLRSTMALIEHYKENPDLERPLYLIKAGYFRSSTKRSSQVDTSFYDLLRNKQIIN